METEIETNLSTEQALTLSQEELYQRELAYNNGDPDTGTRRYLGDGVYTNADWL